METQNLCCLLRYSCLLPTLEIHALMLTDILLLLERDESRDKYYLRTHSQTDVKGDKKELSPVIQIADTICRDAAADRGLVTILL